MTEIRKADGCSKHGAYEICGHTDATCPEKNETHQERIVEGKGLEVISEIGWEKYRAELPKLSYADIIDRQIDQIEELKAKVAVSQKDKTTSPAPQWLIHTINSKAEVRAMKLADVLLNQYSSGKNTEFKAHVSEKKITIRGKNSDPNEKPTTRIYCSVNSGNAPEAFKSLFKSLVDQGAMSSCDVVFNRENYMEDAIEKTVHSNTIIIYVFGKKTETLSKIANALSQAKKENSKDWQLGDKDKVKTKENLLQDLMIPLDDTTGFVEVKDERSYHSGSQGRLYNDISGQFLKRLPLEKLRDKCKPFDSEYPGIFADERDKERRRYMPALILDEKKSTK